MAKRLAQLYTSLIFVDPLAGCLLAWLLIPGGGSGAVQLAVINALVEVRGCCWGACLGGLFHELTGSVCA